MVNYSNGKIYKLWSDQSDMFYIGSTTQKLCKRLNLHKSAINVGKNSTAIEMRSHINISIELIENFPCNSKEELSAKEGEYIRLYREKLLNKQIAGRTPYEYYQIDNREKTKEYMEKYHADNAEKIREQRKKYYEVNKVERVKKDKEYYSANREAKLKYAKEYREPHKEKIQENNRFFKDKYKKKKVSTTFASS